MKRTSFVVAVLFFRQGFSVTMWTTLACLCLLIAGMKRVHHQCSAKHFSKCVGILSACMLPVCSARGSQKRVLAALGLESQMVMSDCVGTRIQSSCGKAVAEPSLQPLKMSF